MEKSLSDLPLSKERTLFWVLAIFSALIWLAAVVSVVGLLVGAVVSLALFMVNGLFIARIKSESAEISPQQMPQLYQIFVDACRKVEMHSVPRLYIMQHGGWLNAFATRFARRHFVVLYSDLVEAFEPTSKELQFIIGHELGHIKQKHLTTGVFVLPGMMLPLLGAAYSRARESTCDRYGAFVANDTNASMRAMLALAGGKKLHQVMDTGAFSEQHLKERGFFISLHELLSTYPTFSKRVADLRAFDNSALVPKVSRNPFAYGFALISFGPGTIVLVYLVFIGVLISKSAPFQKMLVDGQNSTTTEQLPNEAVMGPWTDEQEGIKIVLAPSSVRFQFICSNGEFLEAQSEASFTDSYFSIEKAVKNTQMVGGEECVAEIFEGLYPYKLEGENLVLFEGENEIKFKRSA